MSWRVPAPGPGGNVRSSAGCLPKNVFDAFEERLLVAASVFVEFFLRQEPVQVLERMFLFFCQLLRHRHARNRVEVTLTASIHVWHALAAHLESRSRLRPGRDLNLLASIERGHVDRSAERQCRKTDRHLAIKIVVFAMEERVLLHVNDHVEVSLRTAGAAVFAFAVEPQALASRNARRNLDREFSLAADTTGTTTRCAWLGDRFSGSAAVRTWTRDGKES